MTPPPVQRAGQELGGWSLHGARALCLPKALGGPRSASWAPQAQRVLASIPFPGSNAKARGLGHAGQAPYYTSERSYITGSSNELHHPVGDHLTAGAWEHLLLLHPPWPEVA